MDKIFGGILRTVLASVAGYFIGKGYVNAEDAEVLIGALTTLAVGAWSIYQKLKTSKQIKVAAATGVANNSGAVGIIAALLIALFGGGVIAVAEPKVGEFIANDVLHQDEPGYVVPANAHPTRH